jgi:hypothetical protein
MGKFAEFGCAAVEEKEGRNTGGGGVFSVNCGQGELLLAVVLLCVIRA